jgi:DNA end-binding protein Ku
MVPQKAKAKKTQFSSGRRTSWRPIWTGSIDFGLVTIPVKLHPAEVSKDMDFDLLDKRDFSRVRYKRVNEKTGEEVPWEEIVKGYEYEKGEYVAVSDEDFLQANMEATQSIPITEFVDRQAISPLYFDKPYYLEPLKNGRRAYALLREVLRRSEKVGIAKVVIRSRQHLAALLAEGPVLVVNLLRFAHELRDLSALGAFADNTKSAAAVSPQELKMAERLVEAMVSEWNPQKYRDDYHEDLLKLIDKKVKSGHTKALPAAQRPPRPQAKGKVVDIMHLLRESVNKAGKSAEEKARRRKAG